MSRVVNIDVKPITAACMVTTHSDGSFETFVMKPDDMVEDLRYVDKGIIKTISGRVSSIRVSCLKVTKVKVATPVDYFSKDVSILSIDIDASTAMQSNIVTVNAREIVEFADVTDVTSVHVIAHPIVDMDITYSDETVEHQSLEVGDYLENVEIMTGPGKPDMTGSFKVAAFAYTAKYNKPDITGAYLISADGANPNSMVKFTNFIRFVEVPSIEIASPNSLASIAAALNLSDEVSVSLGVDVDIPLTEQGKISTIMINEGKTVDLDLSGHNLNVVAYAFYVNGGTLNISDTSGEGKIVTSAKNAAYPAVYVNTAGTCNMYSGTIDTSQVPLEEGDFNWMYGVVCSGDGVFNMLGGEMVIGAAAGISITNGTASGTGAQFTIGGDSIITSKECAGVYLADNKAVTIQDNAVINGGIVARIGEINVKGKAKVNAQDNQDVIIAPGVLACQSGVEAVAAGILALTGNYNSALGNDLCINIEDTGMVYSKYGKAIEIGTVNTNYDQVATVYINSKSNLRSDYCVWNHDQLAEQAAEAGKTLKPETNTTDLTIFIAGEQVYPDPDDSEVEAPVEESVEETPAEVTEG